jgi:hypothetical protein
VRSPVSGTQTSEVRKGGHSTSRVAKLRSESGPSIWEWTGGILVDTEVRPSVDHFGVSWVKV